MNMLRKAIVSSVAFATILSASIPAFAGTIEPRQHRPAPQPQQQPYDHGIMASTPTQAIATAESSFPWIPLALFAIGATAALVAGLSGHSHSNPSTPVEVLPN